jgi:hypothetical protein
LLSSASQSDSNKRTTKLAFNNTRAKYEDDRGVWSASMDVFVVSHDRASSPETNSDNADGADDEIVEEPVSEARVALQALKDGTGEDDEDDLSSFLGSIDVLEQKSGSQNDEIAATPAATSNYPNVVGLVNAYFVPGDEIKILVVEIDGILHNVTWKGLD